MGWYIEGENRKDEILGFQDRDEQTEGEMGVQSDGMEAAAGW